MKWFVSLVRWLKVPRCPIWGESKYAKWLTLETCIKCPLLCKRFLELFVK